MKTPSSLGVAFIGAGLVAHMHARAVRACPGAHLVGMFDPRIAAARALTRQYGGRVYRSQEELFADPAVAAVHVLTPQSDHVAAALSALQAGRHVLIEKPVAESVADLQLLKRAGARAGRVCMPAHNYIYVPALQRAKRLVQEGKLGAIAGFWMLYNVFHAEELIRKYGGIIRVVMTHHAYSLLYLLGRPLRLTAVASPGVHYQTLKCEGQASITCEMSHGVIANLWASFSGRDLTNDPWNVLYKILGTKGGLSYSWSEAQFEDSSGPAFGLPCYEEGFHGEVNHFINRCIRDGAEPLSTLDDAIAALQLIATAERAAREHQWFDLPR